MVQKTDVRVFVLLGEDGNFVVARDRHDLHDLYANDFGGLPPATCSISIALNVTRPRDVLVGGVIDAARDHIEVDVN